MDTFALLDDADATPQRPTSRLYTGFLREHRCVDLLTLEATCCAIDADLAAGAHAVLLADYEWGAKLLGAGDTHLAADDKAALRLLVFERLERMHAVSVAEWLAEQDEKASSDGPSPAGVLDLQSSIDRDAFNVGIARIHEAIRAGDTYQVNFTYRMHGRAWGPPIALYRRLRARQRVGFGALIHLPVAAEDRIEWVLSRSPELFVNHIDGELRARPMKGTAVRALPAEGDSETARLLHEDIKNRAENLMIVDLLRNDLGRIAELGSVKVPQLFSVEPYATVFQMTSTVQAQCRPQIGLADLLRATFPCGSITGAPKHHTMQIIADLETTPRGLYTGAIGWLEAGRSPQRACPDLCLSVAIRTLTLEHETDGLRPVTMGVGGGIVLDSVDADEFEETLWKARFLTALDPGLEIFETMRLTAAAGVALVDRHRARMAASARSLGLGFDASAFNAIVQDAQAQAVTQNEIALRDTPPRGWRLRIALGAQEGLRYTLAPLDDLPAGPVRLRIEPEPLPSNPLAQHKTTLRARYDDGIRAAAAIGAFDSLFFGEDGQLIEGGRSNVFLRIDGRWFTPPVSDGALPGVMRAVCLEDAALAASQRRLTLRDLQLAQEVMVCNALRGVLRCVPPDRLSSDVDEPRMAVTEVHSESGAGS